MKDESATGSSTSNRVCMTLTLSVEDIEYDTSACQLRVKDRNIQENQYVKVSTQMSYFKDVDLEILSYDVLKMGAYHTIDLQLNQKFTLAK